MLFGAVAEDPSDALEVAAALARSAVAVTLHLGAPGPEAPSARYDAPAPFEVVALRVDGEPLDDLAAAARGAWDRLAARGATRCYWTYAGTPDTPPTERVGAVVDALADALGEPGALAVHAPPFAARTGGEDGLAGSLGTGTPRAVAALERATVRAGHEAIAAELDAHAAQGVRHVVADAPDESDLVALVRGAESRRLLCGGAAFASHVPALCRVRGHLPPAAPPPVRPREAGHRLVLVDGRSALARARIGAWPAHWPSFGIGPDTPSGDPDAAARWLEGALGGAPVLIHAGGDPDRTADARTRDGRSIEDALGALAVRAVELGVGALVVAGAASAGGVLRAFGIERLGVGPEIAPGVPWCRAHAGGAELAVALSLGPAGGARLFEDAFERLAAGRAPGA